MPFERHILHHGPNPKATPQQLSLSAVRSCWFELHRQGGCGSGQLILSDQFEQRDLIQIGDWISFEVGNGDRWYLGRIEERKAEVPAGIRLRLEGMSVELNQMFPGGFGDDADGAKPHLYAATELFRFDPDNALETVDYAASADEVVHLLLTQSSRSTSHVRYVAERVETPTHPAPVTSLKVRGEESIRSLLKDLAVRAQGASWGVDEQGEFFFLRPRTTIQTTFQEQKDLTRLAETRDMEFVFNRILLTGDYVYDRFEQSEDIARRSYRWRANFLEPKSRDQFGDRRIRIWLPWVRTQSDGLAFAREFFRTYSQPANRYLIETAAQSTLPRPWMGRIRIKDTTGNQLIVSQIETIRVQFDHVPHFRMELGPTDPRDLWPEPPQDERWELPHQIQPGGGDVSIPDQSEPDGNDGDNGGGGGNSEPENGENSHINSDEFSLTEPPITSSDLWSDEPSFGSSFGSLSIPLTGSDDTDDPAASDAESDSGNKESLNTTGSSGAADLTSEDDGSSTGHGISSEGDSSTNDDSSNVAGASSDDGDETTFIWDH